MVLPIHDSLDEIRNALKRAGTVVVHAPPGAGKTTIVPPALLSEEWLGRNRIVMLEPRRLAARAAAHRMSHLRGESVGRTIGYRTRLDTKVSSATRIEVVTEGVLTRMVQQDPTLDGYGLVIFDEFHERSLQGDTGLALVLHTRHLVRPDLRVAVMSATIDGIAVARLLDNAPVVSSSGRHFEVETRYRPTAVAPLAAGFNAAFVAGAVRTALGETEGDVLVFLPGAPEIHRLGDHLGQTDGVDVIALHGSLSPQDQDRAIAPSLPGRRKVVLATSIAETSLTIEGVRVVIDTGLARRSRFSRGRACRDSKRFAYRERRQTSGAAAPEEQRQECAIACGPKTRTRRCNRSLHPKYSREISRRSPSTWPSPALRILLNSRGSMLHPQPHFHRRANSSGSSTLSTNWERPRLTASRCRVSGCIRACRT
jgi:ATP-dependent helicase HrpB